MADSPKHFADALRLIAAVAISFLLGACSPPAERRTDPFAASGGNNEIASLNVITSFSILEDMVQEIGGERVRVHNLVPLGTDPHEYEVLPADLRAASEADLLFYNGLNLEGDPDRGWLARLAEITDLPAAQMIRTSAGIEPLYLTERSGVDTEINPHAFLDPGAGIVMAKNVEDALVAADPLHAREYRQRGEGFIDRLRGVEASYRDRLGKLPDHRKFLVTSERAFQYLAKSYELEEGYIWAIDTEENASPEQLKSLIDFVKVREVPALFVESNVDTRPMETVSAESGVPIAGVVYSDEIGAPGSPADTYISYLEHNLEIIAGALAE